MVEETVQELASALAAHPAPQVVDVREPHEHAAGHVPGARPVPLGQLASRVDELDRSRVVHVVCASGNRSRVACALLDARGFRTRNVDGGTAAWLRAGHAVEAW